MGCSSAWARFAPLQIPDFKTAATADERDLALQLEFFAKFIGENETALFVGRAVLGLRMQLAQIDAQIARRNCSGASSAAALIRSNSFGGMTSRNCPFGSGHHEEFLARAISPPAGGNGDPMFVVELVTKFSRIEN